MSWVIINPSSHAQAALASGVQGSGGHIASAVVAKEASPTSTPRRSLWLVHAASSDIAAARVADARTVLLLGESDTSSHRCVVSVHEFGAGGS